QPPILTLRSGSFLDWKTLSPTQAASLRAGPDWISVGLLEPVWTGAVPPERTCGMIFANGTAGGTAWQR
ncbi:MAG: hypothetical protein OXU81_16390, partial [Gammaproteobacteria bacterium]|nr:hypothetical protein [Gammaproteobacteria bacterium]